LVDLSKDVSELKNLAAANPAVVERIKKLHDAWVKDVGP
jgi:hypothetical protein